MNCPVRMIPRILTCSRNVGSEVGRPCKKSRESSGQLRRGGSPQVTTNGRLAGSIPLVRIERGQGLTCGVGMQGGELDRKATAVAELAFDENAAAVLADDL